MTLPKEFVQTLPLSAAERVELVNTIDSGNSPVSVRINPFKAKAFLDLEKISWCDSAFYLSQRPSFTFDPAFHAGAYYPQEASSMFLSRVLRSLQDSNKPISVLDLCAAPGGKSTLIRSSLRDDDFLLCNEVVPKRASILFDNIQKWGHENTAVSNCSPTQLGSARGLFDIILADVPCSGEGLFRKQPSAIDEWSLLNVENSAKRQRAIIEAIWPSLKEGGVLIYSTCTYNLKENEQNMKWLSERFDLEFLTVPLFEDEKITPSLEPGVQAYRFFPHKAKGEGFFISVVRKLGSTKDNSNKKKVYQNITLPQFGDISLVNKNNEIYVLSEFGMKILSAVKEANRVFSPGYKIGELKKNRFVPSHGFSLWRKRFNNKDLELPYDMAIQYLRGNDVKGAFSARGKIGIIYGGFCLGQGREEKTRVISKYPREYRIKSQHSKDYQQIVEPI